MVDALPDTDELSGSPMPEETVASRWQQHRELVLKHLLNKHEGELKELEGCWVVGQGEVPDALFDPQFGDNEDDFRFCKGFGKSGDSYQRSKHAADYRAVNRRAEGKGKGKDKAKGKDKGKEQPAVGGTGQPAVGGGGGKGKPAVGGKGQLVLARGLPFESNILRWNEDGTWYAAQAHA